MEFPFSVLSVGLELLTIIFCILLFFRGRLRVNGVRSFFILVLLFFVTTGSYFLLRPLFGGGDSFKTLYSIYSLAVIILFLSWLFRESIFVTIFIVFAARNYLDGTNMISDLVSVIWHSASFSGSQTATGFLCRLTVYILLVPVLYHFFKVCIRPAIASTKSMNIWNYLWIIPVSFFFLYRLGFNPYYTAIETGNKNSMLLFPLIWYPGMFFCQLYIFRLLSETSQNIVLREKLHTAELLTEMEKKQYSLLQDNIEGTRKARHDLRHHLLAMRGYAERRDYEGCLRYIEEFLKQTDSYALKQYCDNHAVNSIISYYENTAVSSGVAVSIEIRLPSLLTVPEVDFCTILGNLLSNAVEACLRQTEGERFIRMKLGMAGRSMVTLSVVNSYSGDIREENGIFLSSHHAGEGIGTMSVRHIADQYHGITRFRYEDGVFETSVLLNPEPSGAAADREPAIISHQ